MTYKYLNELDISLIQFQTSIIQTNSLSLNELVRSVIQLDISLNQLEISEIELEISLIHLEISVMEFKISPIRVVFKISLILISDIYNSISDTSNSSCIRDI